MDHSKSAPEALQPLPAEVYESLGVRAFQAFPPADQARINAQCARPSPPARWLSGELVSFPSRAFFEWHWRRGREPGEERLHIPKSTRRRIFARDNETCVYCGCALTLATLQIDHVVPVSRGGDNRDGNLASACRSCNLSKGALTPEEWRS